MSDTFVPEHEPLGAERPDPPAPAGLPYRLRRSGNSWEVSTPDGTVLGYAADDAEYGTSPTLAPDPTPYELLAAIHKQSERIREIELSQAAFRSMQQSAATIYLGYKARLEDLAAVVHRHGMNEPSTPWSGRIAMLEHQVVTYHEKLEKACDKYNRNFANVDEWTKSTQDAVTTYRTAIQMFLDTLTVKMAELSKAMDARDKVHADDVDVLQRRIAKLEAINRARYVMGGSQRLFPWPTPAPSNPGPPTPGPTQAPLEYGSEAQPAEPVWPDPAGDFTITIDGSPDTSLRMTNVDSDKRFPEGPSGNATEDLERMNMWFQATQDLAVSYLKESGIWEKAIAYAERQLDRDSQTNGSADPVTWRSFMESIATKVPTGFQINGMRADAIPKVRLNPDE